MTVFDFMEKYKIISLIITVYFLVIVGWVTYRVFGANVPEISGGTAAALATVYGLPALAIGLLKWRGEFINKRDKNDS